MNMVNKTHIGIMVPWINMCAMRCQGIRNHVHRLKD